VFASIRADLRAPDVRWAAHGAWALAVHRFGRWRYGVCPATLRKPIWVLHHLLCKLVQVFTGIELRCGVQIGRDFGIAPIHGIVASDDAASAMTAASTTAGWWRWRGSRTPPQIGNNVAIGRDAKLPGWMAVSDNVMIGATAVVVRDVPSDSIAVGVPAVVRPRRSA